MKKVVFMLSFVLVAAIGLMSVSSTSPSPLKKVDNISLVNRDAQTFLSENPNLSVEDFLTLTPKKYKELTGKKLGLKKTIMLKVAQKQVKKAMLNPGKKNAISKLVYILLAIFIAPFLAVGLATNWEGSDWWKALLWTLLCGIPGIIYALVKMKNYSFS